MSVMRIHGDQITRPVADRYIRIYFKTEFTFMFRVFHFKAIYAAPMFRYDAESVPDSGYIIACKFHVSIRLQIYPSVLYCNKNPDRQKEHLPERGEKKFYFFTVLIAFNISTDNTNVKQNFYDRMREYVLTYRI